MARPPLWPKEAGAANLNVYLHAEQREKLRKIAVARRVSMAAVVRSLIEEVSDESV